MPCGKSISASIEVRIATKLPKSSHFIGDIRFPRWSFMKGQLKCQLMVLCDLAHCPAF